jgi:predicted CoA-binding protein
MRADGIVSEDWRARILDSQEEITALLERVAGGVVAVLGIKMEPDQPGFYVPAYLQGSGVFAKVVPVPVYYPGVTSILGEKVYRSVAEIPERVDLVDVFRRGESLPLHLEDLIAAKPRAVWFQSGIRNDEVAEELAKAGIEVVQDRCLMIEMRLRRR